MTFEDFKVEIARILPNAEWTFSDLGLTFTAYGVTDESLPLSLPSSDGPRCERPPSSVAKLSVLWCEGWTIGVLPGRFATLEETVDRGVELHHAEPATVNAILAAVSDEKTEQWGRELGVFASPADGES